MTAKNTVWFLTSIAAQAARTAVSLAHAHRPSNLTVGDPPSSRTALGSHSLRIIAFLPTLNHLQLRASNLGLGLSWQGLTAHSPRTFLRPNDCSHIPPRSINPGQRHILQHDYLIPDTSSRIAVIKSSPAVELGQSGTYCGRLRPFCDDISRKHRKCQRLVGTRSHLIWLKVALVAQNSTGKPVS